MTTAGPASLSNWPRKKRTALALSAAGLTVSLADPLDQVADDLGDELGVGRTATAIGRGPVASGARPADARPGRHLRGDLLQPCRSATRGPGLAWNTMFWGFCFALVLGVGSRPYLWRGQTTPGSSEDLDAPLARPAPGRR